MVLMVFVIHDSENPCVYLYVVTEFVDSNLFVFYLQIWLKVPKHFITLSTDLRKVARRNVLLQQTNCFRIIS